MKNKAFYVRKAVPKEVLQVRLGCKVRFVMEWMGFEEEILVKHFKISQTKCNQLDILY
jgi:hypothetical protein